MIAQIAKKVKNPTEISPRHYMEKSLNTPSGGIFKLLMKVALFPLFRLFDRD